VGKLVTFGAPFLAIAAASCSKSENLTVFETEDEINAFYISDDMYYYGRSFEQNEKNVSFIQEFMEISYVDAKGCTHYGELVIPPSTSTLECSNASFKSFSYSGGIIFKGICDNEKSFCINLEFSDEKILNRFKLYPQVPESAYYNFMSGPAIFIK
jgi:hypothetical protein